MKETAGLSWIRNLIKGDELRMFSSLKRLHVEERVKLILWDKIKTYGDAD